MRKSTVIGWMVGVMLVFSPTQTIFAQITPPDHSSNNFGVQQYGFGAGGETDANSASFNARSFIGDVGIGRGSSSLYQAYAGFVTTEEPYLEFSIDESVINFGLLDTSTTAFGSATFRVRTYLAQGYEVTTGGTIPSIAGGGHELANLAVPTAVSPGTEQFGMNLVENTSPVIGADPVQIPNDVVNPFSYGDAATGYDTPDLFKYVTGDVVASSNSSSGVTEYTASYIINVYTTTPAGFYVGYSSFIATSTY